MKNFAVWAVASVVLVLGVIGFFSKQHYDAVFIASQQEEKEKTASYLQLKFDERMEPEDFFMTDEKERNKKFSTFWAAIQSPEFVRMKVWNNDYMVLWVDLGEYTGTRFPDHHELGEAYEGEVEYELAIDESSAENITERQYGELSEIYVPIMDKDKKVLGVLEVYRPTTRLRAESLESTLRFALLWGVVGLTVLSVALTCIHKKCSRREVEAA